MGAVKKILVALGFSRYTESLLKYAAGLADDLGAELIFANIINARDVEAVATIADMGYEVDGDNYVAGVKAERQQAFDKALKKIGLAPSKSRIVFKVGNPSDELLEIAVTEDVDLILMGIKGRTDIEYALIGSVAEKVFRRSPVPILSYRDEENAKRLKKQINFS